MTTLLAHIEAINAGMQARMDAEPGLICFFLTTDIAHWNEGGIFTVEDFDAAMDAEYEREVQKSMYGYDDPYMTPADMAYFDMLEREAEATGHVQGYGYQVLVDEYDYQVWLDEQEMKKWGVDTYTLLPTHYEIMAIRAGFMEY